MREMETAGRLEALDDDLEGGRGYTIREIVVTVRRRWVAVALVFAAVVGLGLWRTLEEPRIYGAMTTVRIQENQSPLSGAASGASYDYRIDPLLSEQEVIRSQVVADRAAAASGFRLVAVRPEDLRRSAIFGPYVPVVDSAARVGDLALRFGDSTFSLRAGPLTYGTARYGAPLSGAGVTVRVPARPDIPDDEVLLTVLSRKTASAIIRGTVRTRVVPSTDIVELSYTASDPDVARDVANAVAETYAEFSREVARTAARKRSAFIAKTVAEQEQRLAEAQDSLKRFKERYQTADVGAEQSALFGNIYKFEEQKRQVLLERSIYESLIGKLAAADTTDEELRRLVSTPAVENNSIVAGLYARWFDLIRQRQSLVSRGFTSAYGDVKTVDSLLARTKQDFQTASSVYLQKVAAQLKSLDENIAQLRTQTERYPPLSADQARLMTNVRTMEQIYADLQSQHTLAKIAESVDDGAVQIIDPAETPGIPVSPNRRRSMAFAAVLGVLLGIAAALLLERLDDTVKSPEELRDRLDLAVLGTIPSIRAVESNGARDDRRLGRPVTHADPRSPVAEAYRSLRTNISFARAHQTVQTLICTSPGPADGKSTTVANLAITFAQQGQRTLLVDADLRRAVLDRTFAVPRSPGLTDVIVGTHALAAVVHETPMHNLAVLGSGEFPPNPSELLGSAAMRRLIETAKGSYDIILFDSPPLLAVTDAAVLATMVDGTVLVVRMGATAREAVRRSVAQLRAVHGRVLGAVLNDVDFKNGAYYGGYGYYYHAYYDEPGRWDGRKRDVVRRLRRLAGRGVAGTSG